MNEFFRKAGLVCVLLAFAAYAYAPLADASLAQDDPAIVAGVSALAFDEGFEFTDLFRVPGSEGRIGAGFSMLLSAWTWSGWLWTGTQEWSPSDAVWIRAENLTLLLLAGWGLLFSLRRALEPWTGKEHARGASRAVVLLFTVHPIVVSSIVRFDARGDLLALAIGSAALLNFLRGRQEQRYAQTMLAGILVMLAALCSPIAFYVPIALTLVEYCSARRHRPRFVRVRTALTTLLVFSTCVALQRVFRGLFVDGLGDAVRPVPEEALASGLFETLLIGIEKLGLLALPVNTFGLGGIGYLLAAVVLLVSMHPAFVAARSAPRLWGRILFGWLVAIGLTELPAMSLRVYPQSLENAHVLLFSALVMAIGLGIGATALSGLRRVVFPVTAGVLYATLAQGAARPWRAAGVELAELRHDLLEQAEARDWKANFLILDAPKKVAGLTSLRGSWSLLLDPTFVPREERPQSGVRLEAAGMTLDAFRAYVREPEFDERRAKGLTLLLPARALPSAAQASSGSPRSGPGRPWRAIDLPVPTPSVGDLVWRSEGSSPTGQVLEALGARALVVNALPGTQTLDEPRLRWSARSEVVPEGGLRGAWLRSDDGPVAIFEQGSDLGWLLGGRIRATWFTGELASIASAEVRAGLPDFGGEVAPLERGDDWVFDLGELPIPESFGREREWSLGLLDLGRLEFRRFDVLGSAVDGLRVEDAASVARQWLARGGGPLVWSLDLSFGGSTVARATGRIRS